MRKEDRVKTFGQSDFYDVRNVFSQVPLETPSLGSAFFDTESGLKPLSETVLLQSVRIFPVLPKILLGAPYFSGWFT